MQNNATVPVTFTQDQKIAQFIFEQASIPQVILKECLSETSREGGFGSTDAEKQITPMKTSKQHLKRLFISPTTTVLYSKNQKLKPIVINNANGEHYAKLMKENNIPTDSDSIPHPELIPTDILDKVIAALTPTVEQIRTYQSKHTTTNTQIKVKPATYVVNKSLPKNMRVDRRFIEQSTGLSNVDNVINAIPEISTNTLSVSKDVNPILGVGSQATMNNAKTNKKNSKPPPKYGQIWHMDIGFGPCRAIGGIRYTLLLIDKSTRFKFIFGLKNLNDSIHEAMEEFLQICGTTPELIRTDFDSKLIGGKVKQLLRKEKILLQAAPPKHQQQNGLVKRHWAFLVKQARQWLTASLLPSSYWWFAIKCACEINNILKAPHKKENISPYQLVTGEKPDYRQLFPMFSVAYMKYAQEK